MNDAPIAQLTGDINEMYSQIFSGTTTVTGLIIYVIVVVALWKVFTKAGYSGILAIIPIVNVVFLVKIAGMSGWFALLYLVPIVGWVFAIVVAIKLGARFGKGWAFSLFLLWLLPFIGYFILGFGKAHYRGN